VPRKSAVWAMLAKQIMRKKKVRRSRLCIPVVIKVLQIAHKNADLEIKVASNPIHQINADPTVVQIAS